MTQALIAHASAAGIVRLTLDMHPENRAAAALARLLGATVRFAGGRQVVTLAPAVSRAA